MKEFKTIQHPINLIFLDIDGVLNTGNYLHYQWLKNGRTRKGIKNNPTHNWCPMALSFIDHLLNTVSDSYIVISSTWRLSYPDTPNWLALINNFKSNIF